MKFRGVLLFGILSLTLVLAGGLSKAAPQSETGMQPDYTLTDLLLRVPVQDSGERVWLNQELLKHGPAGIRRLAQMLVPSDIGDDASARFALNDLALYVTQSGNEQARSMVEDALLEALPSTEEPELEAFLMRQLEIVGTERSVPALGRYLVDEDLYEPAAQTMVAIGTPAAQEALVNTLPDANNLQQATILKALGDLGSGDIGDVAQSYVDSENRRVRRAALYAVAKSGTPAGQRIFERALQRAEDYDKTQISALYMQYLYSLAEQGHVGQAADICLEIVENTSGDLSTVQVRSNALSLFTQIRQTGANEVLIDVMASENKALRNAALALAADLSGEAVTRSWVDQLAQTSSPEKQAEIIRMLGRRNDAAALDAVSEHLRSADQEVRAAAVNAAVQLGGTKVYSELLQLIQNPMSDDDIPLVRDALLRLSGDQIMQGIAGAIPSAPPAGRAALIEVLAGRRQTEYAGLFMEQARSDNPSVRMAAIRGLENVSTPSDLPDLFSLLLAVQTETERMAVQRSLVTTARKMTDPAERSERFIGEARQLSGAERGYVIRALSQIGGQSALDYVVEQTQSSDEAALDAAIRALTDWPDAAAVWPLLDLAETASSRTHRILALRGSIELVNNSDWAAFHKLEYYKKALPVAERPQEKRQIFGGLANLRIPEAIEVLGNYLSDQDVGQEAALTIMSAVAERPDNSEDLSAAEIAEGLIASAGNAEVRDQVRSFLDRRNLNQPPEGFTALFNGNDLSGWKGLVANPVERQKMSASELEAARKKANESMRQHWSVQNGILQFDGQGESLCTQKKYGDFELLVDWKIEPGGDSGIYLRGTPQVQIWDYTENPAGSGGLYNNQNHPSKPLKRADKPIGEWNRFRIKMVGERVTVHLNGELVVDNVMMENYWERDKSISPTEQIELQAHNTTLYFRNIFLREIPREDLYEGPLFNGKDLTGWEIIDGREGSWHVEDNILYTQGAGGGWLSTTEQYGNFRLSLEFRVPPGGNSGVFLRAPHQGNPAYRGMEIQVLDDYAEQYATLQPWQYTGSVYAVEAPLKRASKNANEWQRMEILCDGPRVRVTLNGTVIVNTNLIKHMDKTDEHPGLKRRRGYIGLQNHSTRVDYRNIRIQELP